MSPAVELVCVWVPLALGVAFVCRYGLRRVREGLSPLMVLMDRNFLVVFLYTGALLSIYLSCLYFFYLVPKLPAPAQPGTGSWPLEVPAAHAQL